MINSYFCNNFNTIHNILSKQISFICRNDYKYFFAKSNVQAIGLGYKESNGIITPEICIKCFVSKKLSPSTLSNSALIPITYNGIKTDVVESGFFTPCSLTNKVRPAPGGYSVGPNGFNTSGTLGCMVKNTSERAYYILSTNHTLTQFGKAKISTPILQPGMLDGGREPTDTVAHLTRYIPIRFKTFFKTPVNYVDAAIAKVTDISLISPQIAIINRTITRLGSPLISDRIFKVGKTTERTSGFITAIDTTQKITYPKGEALFKDQILTSAQGSDGDSGSILVNTQMEALGMLTSASANFTCFNEMVHILSQLQIELVTQSELNNIFN